MLNLPIMNDLKDSKNILIAGAGGGFDVFVGCPIAHTLNSLGFNCVYFNYSFTDLPNAGCYSTFKYYPPISNRDHYSTIQLCPEGLLQAKAAHFGNSKQF